MYIDVIVSTNLISRFVFTTFRNNSRLLGQSRPAPTGLVGLDPGLALAIIYLYCARTRHRTLMHGERHLGVTDDEASRLLVFSLAEYGGDRLPQNRASAATGNPSVNSMLRFRLSATVPIAHALGIQLLPVAMRATASINFLSKTN